MTSKFDGLECICDTCMGDGSVCYAVGSFYAEPGADFAKLCSRYRKRRVSNWERLFGTPERAARTIAQMCESVEYCSCCPLYKVDAGWCRSDDEGLRDVIIWLQSEVDE